MGLPGASARESGVTRRETGASYGMSGTGKSTVIGALAARGYRAVDADEGGLSDLVDVSHNQLTGLGSGKDWIWQEDRIQQLVSADDVEVVFLGGCSPNQGKVHPQFDHIVLLTAPASVIVDRLSTRTNNPYGKRPGEIERTLLLQQSIEPLLRAVADHEIDTSGLMDRVLEVILTCVDEAC